MVSVFEYDFGDFEVGTSEDKHMQTGSTVLAFPGGATGAIDTRGGAICGRHLGALALSHASGRLDALVFSGGGAPGLDSATGVWRALAEEALAEESRGGESRGGESRAARVDRMAPPTVVAAATMERQPIHHPPDAALGRRAYEAAKAGRVQIGAAGAGTGCTVGGWFGPAFQSTCGQGAAQIQFAEIKIFALSVVNALGNIVDDRGKIVRGVRRPGGGYDAVWERIGHALESAEKRSLPPSGHTTLTAIVTNLHLDRPSLQRLAVMAHAATARVIDPIWAPEEGDAIFAISTGTVSVPKELRLGDLGVVAGRVVQEAILTAARESSS